MAGTANITVDGPCSQPWTEADAAGFQHLTTIAWDLVTQAFDVAVNIPEGGLQGRPE